MNVSTVLVVGFLTVAGLQRFAETFARRGTTPGRQQMQWSFYAFFTLHAIVLFGTLTEFLVWRREAPQLLWSVLGLVLYVFALVLRNLAIRTLGRFWSLHVEIRDQHRLVREGIYRLVRHPAYSAIVLEVLAIPVVANAWWTLGFAAMTYVPLLWWRLRWEERALVEKFGDEYRAYQQQVGALVPRPWRFARGNDAPPSRS